MRKQKTVLYGLTGLLGLAICAAEEIEELDALTVLARRIDSARDENASSVGIVTADELARMQRHRLLESLNLVPGTQVLSTAGLTGNTGSAIIRGLPSRYQQVLVDGVRISDNTNALGNFLANGQLGQITNLEVLRGPQSVLYGTGAGGGVIGYETAVGTGAIQSELFAEGGSFDTYRTSLSSHGKLGDFAYGAEIGYQVTDNDTYSSLPRHDYEQSYLNLALQWQLRDDLRLKLTYRGTDNLLETRSITGFGASDSVIETDTALISANLFYDVNPRWESRFTAGYYYENYRGDFGGFLFGTDSERWTINWSNEVELGDSLTAVGGVESSISRFSNSDGRSVSESIVGAYANFYYRPIESLLLEGGARYDEHNEFDGDVAWNLGMVYRFPRSGTRLHARVSEAYRNPSRLDSEFFPGLFSTQLANPNLESEQILGWEAGVSQELAGHEFTAIFYHQDLEDAIVTDASGVMGQTRRINSSGQSSVSGLEVSAKGRFLKDRVSYRVAFTSQFDEEVIDLPDQMISFDMSYDQDSWLIGAGASYVGQASYLAPGNPRTDSRLVSRIYGQFQVNEALLIHARVENLFDESYQLFPDTFGAGTEVEGPGRAVFVGATLKW